ncbi:unnamed protein product [Adineta ricciae]|uniref:Uncharacterized protein n=1 Tax=Adineta ricciae TaxID=249248 RepID=A0A815W9J8_ADIRI|nr:unnamed protein product [Adineta ricciae]
MPNLNAVVVKSEDQSPLPIEESTEMSKVLLKTSCKNTKKKILLPLFIFIIVVAITTTLIIVVKKRNVEKTTLTIGNITMEPLVTKPAELSTTTTKDPSSSSDLHWNTKGITIGINSSPKLSCSRLFIDSNDTLYGVDNTKAYVWKLSKNDTNATIIAGIYGSSGQSSFQLHYPEDVYVNQYGDIYVVDTNNHRIQKFVNGKTEGVTIAGQGVTGNGSSDLLLYPRDFAFDSTETFMYVADRSMNRILRFLINSTVGKSGTVVFGNEQDGNQKHQVNGPWSIYLLPPMENTLFIANHDGHSIMRWSIGEISGTFVAGKPGFACSDSDCLHDPTDVLVDDHSNIYVVDSLNHRIQMFCQNNKDGETIIGNGIRGNNSTQLSEPRGIAFDSAMNMYVCDTGNYRVQKFLKL